MIRYQSLRGQGFYLYDVISFMIANRVQYLQQALNIYLWITLLLCIKVLNFDKNPCTKMCHKVCPCFQSSSAALACYPNVYVLRSLSATFHQGNDSSEVTERRCCLFIESLQVKIFNILPDVIQIYTGIGYKTPGL